MGFLGDIAGAIASVIGKAADQIPPIETGHHDGVGSQCTERDERENTENENR